jgi:hypothetical protein
MLPLSAELACGLLCAQAVGADKVNESNRLKSLERWDGVIGP